jgi:hypothetical protein
LVALNVLELEKHLSAAPLIKKGLSFISNRRRRKEGMFSASKLAGIKPTPPAPEEQGMPALYKTVLQKIIKESERDWIRLDAFQSITP